MSDSIQDKILQRRKNWREWYYRNRSEVLEQRKFKRTTTTWHAKNRIESQSYYMRNREKILQKRKEFRENNRDKANEYAKQYYRKKKNEELQEIAKTVPKPKEKRKPVKPDHRKRYAKKIREKICNQGFYELPKSENPFLVTWD